MLHTTSPSPRPLSFILLTLVLAFNLTCIVVIKTAGKRGYNKSTHVPHTYLGTDYPCTWDIGTLAPVLASSEPDTSRYQMHGADAEAEWEAMTPGHGFVYLGDQHRQFSLSMFHQLRCLDIIRGELVRSEDDEEAPAATELTEHCLNYLRQMVLCRSDCALVPVLGKPDPELYPDTLLCTDWRQVYAAVARNQEDHRQWISAQATSSHVDTMFIPSTQ
ncbi:hypothetical protein BV25DRAFT_1831709 [Artomyces pyxidatus]|uniref:Uncharacterized protein n=1 Tax=Artomyces pyxidatus TaxID=48021 RepID=A0ACB8SM09_9AGAM|nr:hypothetical protein BV25DRAFT_1831709 [Artomyces pyxidatus]